MYSLALIIFVVSEKKAFEHFPIGSNVKMFQNASSLKPLGQLKPNCPGMIIGRSSTKCPGMIIGRSSTKFLFFMSIGNPKWPPSQWVQC
jgi:hypothetical protein